jgi:hypothetical protein
MPREKLLIRHRQTVLVGCRLDAPVEELWGSVRGTDRDRGSRDVGVSRLDQTKVRDFHMVAAEKKIFRLHVQMLEPVSLIQQIENLGRFSQIVKQFFSRDAGQTQSSTFAKTVGQALIGQFHDDDQIAIHDFESLDREEIRMSNLADLAKPVQLSAMNAVLPGIDRCQLDGFGQTPRGFGLPNFTKTTSAEIPAEFVAGNGLCGDR